MMYSYQRQSGFTLIELMVVLAIVSIMATIVLGAFNSARDKAYTTKAKADARAIIQAIIIAQGERNQQLVTFASNANWTAGFCTALGHVPTEPGCLTRVNTAMSQIEAATNGVITGLPRVDPWGMPYQFDANYGENVGNNYCLSDSFYLVKPDGSTRTIPGLMTIPSEPKYPGCP